MLSPFTDEHQLFRKQIKQFMENELAPASSEWEKAGIFPRWVFKKAAELGVFAAHYPEDVGGGGGDYWFSVAKAEELHRCESGGVVMALLVQGDMTTPCIQDLGSKEQKEEFLKPALQGEKIAALAVSEPNAGSDVAAITTTARRVGDEYVINGSKTYITNGSRADFVTLLVKTDPEAGYGGISIVLLPTDVKGYGVSKMLKKIGNCSSDTAELFFDGCRVPARYLLGEEGQGFYYLMQNFQTERLIASISAVAGAYTALERTVEWGGQRSAFGKPLIKREVWQHRFVDLYTKLEAARALSYQAVRSYNQEKYIDQSEVSLETTKFISMSKVFVGDVTSEIIDTCLQFHGGMGYLDELWVSRMWRDQRLLRIAGGSTEVMKYALSKIMGF
ncbi:MAG: acyl-CoA dehydrogenase family protein [Myxococcales bacterium]|nr:MAG: acyl-CoA dehydrogenase family protein [Myxococcales bacterium]